MVVVIKKDGRVRLRLDARKINQIIIPDRESPEAIEEIFQKFSGVKYMTSLDPVSYTHLDVYKRQLVQYAPKPFPRITLPYSYHLGIAAKGTYEGCLGPCHS